MPQSAAVPGVRGALPAPAELCSLKFPPGLGELLILGSLQGTLLWSCWGSPGTLARSCFRSWETRVPRARSQWTHSASGFPDNLGKLECPSLLTRGPPSLQGPLVPIPRYQGCLGSVPGVLTRRDPLPVPLVLTGKLRRRRAERLAQGHGGGAELEQGPVALCPARHAWPPRLVHDLLAPGAEYSLGDSRSPR